MNADDDKPVRDQELGAALRKLEVPDYEPGFQAQLRARLEQEPAPPNAAKSPGTNGLRRALDSLRGRHRHPFVSVLVPAGALAAVLLGIVLSEETSRIGVHHGPLSVEPATAAQLSARVQRAVALAHTLSGLLSTSRVFEPNQPPQRTRVRFLLTSSGNLRLVESGGEHREVFRARTGVDISVGDPNVNGGTIISRGVATPGGPDRVTLDPILGDQLAGVVRTLREAGKTPIHAIRFQGRRGWRVEAPEATNKLDLPGTSGDHVEIVVDRATGIPLRMHETYHGKLVNQRTITHLRVNAPVPAGSFSLNVPKIPTPLTFDYKFRAVSFARAKKVAGYAPLAPRWLPAGFRRAETKVARQAQATGNEGANPISRGVVTTAYRDGFRLVLVTTRRVGPRPSAWADPMAAGEGFLIAGRRVHFKSGALSGSRAEILLDPRHIPHVWAVTRTLVVTVSGDLSARELLRVGRSLATS